MTTDTEGQAGNAEDGLPSNRLTRAEIRELRDMLESERRMKWLWSTGRIWAAWFTGTIIGIYSLYDTVEKFLKRIIGQ